ncbi:MAG: hypothetical protein IJH68_10220 [Thermoguttaceae bacterium]|nr:hypothetical protein [Thermoguttaceae bacterium]
MDQKKNDSKTVSPFLSIAAALSCGGAVLVGLIWLVLMFYCEHEVYYRGLILTMLFTGVCAFVEVPLLTVWGICADRKNKIALNLDNPKKDSGVLNSARSLSFACFIAILFSSLEALAVFFGYSEKQYPHALEIILKIIFGCMASITYIAFLIAPIAVPILFIRNIYAHLKWRKTAKQKVRETSDLPRDKIEE